LSLFLILPWVSTNDISAVSGTIIFNASLLSNKNSRTQPDEWATLKVDEDQVENLTSEDQVSVQLLR